MTSGSTSATSEYTVIVARESDAPDARFLMVRHRERGWELPGGKLEGREGPVRCALREFKEETGHLLDDPRFVLKLQKENGTCFVFTGTLGVRVGVVEEEDVIEEMDWFDRLPEPLAFPDDPYDEMGEALGLTFGRNG